MSLTDVMIGQELLKHQAYYVSSAAMQSSSYLGDFGNQNDILHSAGTAILFLLIFHHTVHIILRHVVRCVDIDSSSLHSATRSSAENRFSVSVLNEQKPMRQQELQQIS